MKFLETWFGKTVYIISIYVIYWVVFYGSWFLMPEEWFREYDSEFFTVKSNLIFILLFLIIPILSFFIPHCISRKVQINKKLLYFIHIVLIILSILLFLHIGLTIAFKNWSIG